MWLYITCETSETLLVKQGAITITSIAADAAARQADEWSKEVILKTVHHLWIALTK